MNPEWLATLSAVHTHFSTLCRRGWRRIDVESSLNLFIPPLFISPPPPQGERLCFCSVDHAAAGSPGTIALLGGGRGLLRRSELPNWAIGLEEFPCWAVMQIPSWHPGFTLIDESLVPANPEGRSV